MTGSANREEGFTLLEALISMVILAVGILAAELMISMAVNSNSLGNQYTEAAAFSDSVLTSFRQEGWNDPDLTPGTHSGVTMTGTTGVSYTIAWTVTSVDLDLVNGTTFLGAAKFISMTTLWPGTGGSTRTYPYQGSICNPAVAPDPNSVYYDYCNR